MNIRNTILAGLILAGLSSQAQDSYYFTNGLSVPAGTMYGREALYKDPLAWQLYNHTLKTPVEGGTFSADEKGVAQVWQTVVTDSLHQFRPVRGSGGGFGFASRYLYLTYTSDQEKTALLHVKGDAGLFFNGVPHAGDPYGSGWLYIPVRLRKGLNELYVRPSGPVTAGLIFGGAPVQLNTEDPTVPVIDLKGSNGALQAAVVVINGSEKPLRGYRIEAVVAGRRVTTEIPEVPPMATRKVSFTFDASAVTAKGGYDCALTLLDKNRKVDEKKLSLEAAAPGGSYSVTFASQIDGSLQYYAVTPQSAAGEGSATVSGNGGAALFLSVHGAGVEAIGQARAYRSKDWGTLVAATNRRPRGFNWEDWGRLDALEVLGLAKERFHPDERHIYLTGHSMGGHGTWFLGATYPDHWAAIGSCSGYPSLKDYGSHDGIVPDSGRSPIEDLLLRASDQSDVIKLATNYKPLGVYILHGDSDKVVPVRYARQMRKVLADFQADLSYYEYPGGEHWFGNQCVDWDPLFHFFQWHSRKPDSLVDHVDFMTASPGISDAYYWASIRQQLHPLSYSRMRLVRNLHGHSIEGETENVKLLRLSLADFGAGVPVRVVLDGTSPIVYTTTSGQDSLYLEKGANGWSPAATPGVLQKGPLRYGTLKDAFNHRMVFVYSTGGNTEENTWSQDKARYDAETWYYRGNGAVDIVADKDFNANVYAGRGIILYGNASTNRAWKALLEGCPIQVERNKVSLGDKVYTGDDLGAYFVWPLKNSPLASVAVIGGSGLKGMEAANANQYFAGASGFPDFMIFGLEMLSSGSGGIRTAGFFTNDWKLGGGDWVENR